MNDLAKKFWIALCRNTGEGGAGGAGGEGGQAGTEPAGGEGAATVAGGDDPSPSLLSRAADTLAGNDTLAGGDTLASGEDDGTKVEPPAALDLTALTLPEGITLDEEVGKNFAEVLGDAALTPQERGQKLVDMHLATVSKITETVTQQVREAGLQSFKDMNSEWEKQTRALPEFKADPEAEMGKVLQVLSTLGAGEEFFKAVDLTGAGNHPAIMQVLHRLVQPFLEGGSVNGDGKPVPKRELGSNIYKSATQPS